MSVDVLIMMTSDMMWDLTSGKVVQLDGSVSDLHTTAFQHCDK